MEKLYIESGAPDGQKRVMAPFLAELRLSFECEVLESY